jgi:GNAT superfamily N-acetyltransferase
LAAVVPFTTLLTLPYRRRAKCYKIRNARESDIPRLIEIRAAVRENELRDASRVTFADYQWFIANPGMFVWEEGDSIVGFSAADPRDGSVWALFMDQAYEGRGIAQLLFERACAVLRNVSNYADAAGAFKATFRRGRSRVSECDLAMPCAPQCRPPSRAECQDSSSQLSHCCKACQWMPCRQSQADCMLPKGGPAPDIALL